MRKPMGRAAFSLSLATVAGLLLASGASAQTLRGYLRDAESGQPIYLALIVMFTEPGDSVGFTITNQQGWSTGRGADSRSPPWRRSRRFSPSRSTAVLPRCRRSTPGGSSAVPW